MLSLIGPLHIKEHIHVNNIIIINFIVVNKLKLFELIDFMGGL